MARAPLVALLLLAAGCLGGEEDADGDAPTIPGRGAASSRAPSAPPEGADRLPSVAVAPVWQMGEWWRVRLASPLFADTYEWTRVVAGIEGQDYLVGQPRDEWSIAGLIAHVPGLGEVSRKDLSVEVHDARFHVLKFPLADGTEWDTEFEGRPVTAQATANTDGTVSLFYCCGRTINATYDPRLNEVSMFDVAKLFRYDILDHGFDFEGVVTVPHGHDLVFLHGRVNGVLGADAQPHAPTETLELSSDYDRVSFFQLVGGLTLTGPLDGVYRETATGPDGTVYETERLPVEGPGLTSQLFETTELGGTWEFQHVAGGPGAAFTEGIAYHVFDVELPSGRVLGDHSEHVTP